MSKHQFTGIRIPIEKDNPAIMRHEELCIKCGACRKVCENEIAVGRLYDLGKTGDVPICIHCGQCANVCPVNSITEQYEYQQVKKAIADPEKIVIFSTSPSVRVGIGEAFGYKPGTFFQGKMVAALRALGADYVLDTNFGADLTIMEEAAELVERVKAGGADRPLPQFTSCCPAWVKFAETFYPELLSHLSTAKSPIGMQGPTIKAWFAKQQGIDPQKIVNVAVTPCTAKKFEIRREEMSDAGNLLHIPGLRDMDLVITTRELAKWMREEGIDFSALPDGDYDTLMGPASGGGIIFGNTGGVMEAAARTAFYRLTGKNPPKSFLELKGVRGLEGIKTTTIHIGDAALNLAVAQGTNNARNLIEELKQGKQHYDFIEVMTCPGDHSLAA
jgi:ferredoxin hydrogenase